MKLETLFDTFDQFAEVPDAVAKMRELVLQLAVRGRLTRQNPQDEPSSKAIERIVADNNARRTSKLLADEGPSEVPFAVPTSWNWARLGDLVRIRTGKLDANAAVNGGSYPFFTCSKTPSTIASYSFDTSAVILAGNGDFNLKLYSGKFDAYQRTYVIEPLGWELRFCFWLISAQIKRITDSQRGSAIPYLRLGDIANPIVPFPPLAEQKRIVTKIDQLMALCDRLEVQQQERGARHAALARASLARFTQAPISDNLDFIFHKSYHITPAELRKAILTLAIQGKLVERAQSDEPIDILLREMRKRRQQLIEAKRIRQPEESLPIAEEELPFSVPDPWQWTRWNNICDWVTYGFTRPMSHVDKGPPIVTAKSVQDGFMTFENAPRAEMGEFSALSRKDLPRKGDILITKDGTIGRAAIVDTDEPFCINQSVAVLWLESCLLYRPFLLMVIRSPFAQGQIWEAAEGMAIKHLSITDFGRMILPIPPLAEQRRIAAKVNQLMALVSQLETQLAASHIAAANLLDSIVSELTARA